MKKALLLFLLCCAVKVNAADIYFSGNFVGLDPNIPKHLVISGTIEPGDLNKLLALARSAPAYFFISLGSVQLDSPGGNISETMKMAQTLTKLYPVVSVRGKCTSSCLLLWLSGVLRAAGPGQIGVHRPYFEQTYFRDLPVAEANRRYSEMSKQYKKFLLRQGFPESLYEKLNATPSSDVYWLTVKDLELVGASPPYYQEKLLASCGQLLHDDMKFLNCHGEISAPERIINVDLIIGDKKNEQWEHFKKSQRMD